jgi:hypothetical protein
VALRGGYGEMRIGSSRNHRNDPRHSNLGAFFDRPFHAVEFENGEDKRQLGGGLPGHFLAERELHAFPGDRSDRSAPHGIAGCDIEFLSNLCAQNAAQVGSVFTSEEGCVSVDFIGDPAAAGH